MVDGPGATAATPGCPRPVAPGGTAFGPFCTAVVLLVRLEELASDRRPKITLRDWRVRTGFWCVCAVFNSRTNVG